MTGWGRARLALIALAIAAVLFVFVFPTRSYLAQRRQVAAAAHDLAVLREQNAQLGAEAQRLQSQAEIERMAREKFGMVFPGEIAYKVLPAPAGPTAGTTTTTVP